MRVKEKYQRKCVHKGMGRDEGEINLLKKRKYADDQGPCAKEEASHGLDMGHVFITLRCCRAINRPHLSFFT